MVMAGDSLARGARSATFGPAKSVSQKKWDSIWEEADASDKKAEEDSGKNEKLNGK